MERHAAVITDEISAVGWEHRICASYGWTHAAQRLLPSISLVSPGLKAADAYYVHGDIWYLSE